MNGPGQNLGIGVQSHPEVVADGTGRGPGIGAEGTEVEAETGLETDTAAAMSGIRQAEEAEGGSRTGPGRRAVNR